MVDSSMMSVPRLIVFNIKRPFGAVAGISAGSAVGALGAIKLSNTLGNEVDGNLVVNDGMAGGAVAAPSKLHAARISDAYREATNRTRFYATENGKTDVPMVLRSVVTRNNANFRSTVVWRRIRYHAAG